MTLCCRKRNARAAAWWAPWFLAVLPAALVVRSVVRTRSLNPVTVLQQCARVLAFLPRSVVVNAALIYGSIRFRCLVL